MRRQLPLVGQLSCRWPFRGFVACTRVPIRRRRGRSQACRGASSSTSRDEAPWVSAGLLRTSWLRRSDRGATPPRASGSSARGPSPLRARNPSCRAHGKPLGAVPPRRRAGLSQPVARASARISLRSHSRPRERDEKVQGEPARTSPGPASTQEQPGPDRQIDHAKHSRQSRVTTPSDHRSAPTRSEGKKEA
jgi:hypothetical protein